MNKTIIIIPTYNESQNITNMINLLLRDIFPKNSVDILIVDSASTDGTAEKVISLRGIYNNLFLIQQKKKEGLASAYIEGMQWALKQGYTTIVQMDADFQHPVEILPKMLAETCNYDLIIGSRYVSGGSWDNKKIHLIKSFISSIGSLYSRIVLNCPIKDLTGGYNVWSKKALSLINFNNLYSQGYMFQIEMKYITYKNNMKILEYPIKFFPRKTGKSKMDIRIVLEALFKIWKLRI